MNGEWERDRLLRRRFTGDLERDLERLLVGDLDDRLLLEREWDRERELEREWDRLLLRDLE